MSKKPTSSDIKDALERVVNSDIFARSGRARELLSYLVEQEQAGNGALLKGFSIAQDVFGKNDEFDPSTDAVVRVQAGRLRENLGAYYEGSGSQDSVRISIPRGTYVPAYEVVDLDANNENSDLHTGRIVIESSDKDYLDFGAPTSSLSLDERPEQIDVSTVQSAQPIVGSNVAVSPFVVKAIKRFSFGILAMIFLLIIMLFLIWSDYQHERSTWILPEIDTVSDHYSLT